MTVAAMDESRLAAWLSRASPPWADPVPGGLVLLGEGWESDVYGFELAHGPAAARVTERLVVRLYAGAGAAETARREFAGMQLLHAAGYPVPRVAGVEPDAAPLGRPFLVMEWVASSGGWPWSRLDDEDMRAMFVALFHHLHTVDWRPFAAPTAHPDLAAGRGVERTLAEWRSHLARHPLAGFGRVMSWLERRLPALPRVAPAVVHWDFHPGNVLLAPDGSARVVDWTEVGVTDPRFDVAWTALLRATATGDYRPGRARALVEHYERLAGPLAGMAFFDIAAIFRRLYSIVASLEAGPEALGMRPEAADLMRAQIPTLAGPYEEVRRTTGIRLPAIETLLAR